MYVVVIVPGYQTANVTKDILASKTLSMKIVESTTHFAQQLSLFQVSKADQFMNLLKAAHIFTVNEFVLSSSITMNYSIS